MLFDMIVVYPVACCPVPVACYLFVSNFLKPTTVSTVVFFFNYFFQYVKELYPIPYY
jgi:hypothetical protein